jgi:hypothetical protein
VQPAQAGFVMPTAASAGGAVAVKDARATPGVANARLNDSEVR